MSVLVGFGPDVRSTSGLRLAAQLAASSGAELVLCCVVHDAFDSPGLRDAKDVDAEWRSHLQHAARDAIETARAALPEGQQLTTVVRSGRSVPRVLREEAARREAEILVAGPASVGSLGRIALGSTTDRLVHSADVPVALAPRGYRPDGALQRIVLAVEPTSGDAALATPAARLAARLGLPLDVVTYLVRRRSAAGAFAEQGVLPAWREQVASTHRGLTHDLRGEGVDGGSARVVEGHSWSSALDATGWRGGDLLVVGSSHYGPVASVFLGSTAARIVRHSPVPVVLLPR